jgi:hypothetical protein
VSWYVSRVGTWSRVALDDAAFRELGLSPEEGFVLSRLDAPLTSSEVVSLTGFTPEHVEEVLIGLARKGAVASSEPLPALDELIEVGPADEPAEEGNQDDDAPPGPQLDEGNFRKLYENEFRALPRDARIELARVAVGERLLCLCSDPDPLIIRAVASNREYGFAAARLIARHHVNPTGLEAVAQRPDILSDAQVQRALLRNVQLSEALARRVLMPRRMMDSYKASIDTDVPERTRQFARSVLRTKFATAQGEERAGLVCATEGRVLAALTGLTFDARATQILCARSYTSVLFVQALARFGACPPPLLAHLLKQPLVRRQQHLRNLLLQHPNMPSEAKRRM